jgi:hypothetical protein
VLADAYPPLVENYLVTTLARRLELKPVRLPTPWSAHEFANDMVALLTGAESVRVAAQSRTLLARSTPADRADQPLPEPIDTPEFRLPEFDKNAAIEPIAQYVPQECFYVRCGSYANFVWLREAIDHWGTGLRHIGQVRGYDYRIAPRLEKQLALKDTVLGRLLGDTVISDVAILGTDTFVREGPAIGILFEARASAVLARQINQLRKEAADADPRAAEEQVEIAGRKVSLLATPDNQIRSFYAVEGNYHLVTTSSTIVRRFFEAAAGTGSLGRLDEFRWARSKMPLGENHAAFIYLSDPFFRNLISPHYRIEMTRRAQALSEIDVVRIAQLAARGEGSQAQTIDEMILEGYLPQGFGRRPDGGTVIASEDRVIDSLRGAYGSFLPVPDMTVHAATPLEVRSYRAFAAVYRSEWREMDPVVVGVRRRDLDEQKERVGIDILVTPYARQRYEWMREFMSKADREMIAPVPGDIAGGQVNLRWSGASSKLAIGVRDWIAPAAFFKGNVHYSWPREEDFPLYLLRRNDPSSEASALAGLMTWDTQPPDAQGDVRGRSYLGTVWSRTAGDFTLLAPTKTRLNEIAPHLKVVPGERPAMIRLWVGDLSQASIRNVIDAEAYSRARRVSAGGAQFMHALAQQLNLPLDQSKSTAEHLVDAELICPLDGQYVLSAPNFAGLQRWYSDAWSARSVEEEWRVPDNFRSPLWNWFAGGQIEFSLDATTLSAHLELDIRKQK